MSYGKKDEDADQAIVKVDRTAVFQEGIVRFWRIPHTSSNGNNSSPFQLLANIATEMPNLAYEDLFASLHWRNLPFK